MSPQANSLEEDPKMTCLKGFTLIEAVVSLFILSIGIVAGLGFSQAGQTGMDAGRRLSEAAGLAQEKMEERMSLTYYELSGVDSEEVEALENYRRTTTLERDVPGPGFMTLRVSVGWAGKSGRFYQAKLVTVRSAGVVP